MEINSTNFSVCLKQITDFLSNVEFGCFDLLTTGDFDQEKMSQFDNSIQRYEKMFLQNRKVQILKIGISLFGYKNDKLEVKSYNISLFPQTFRGQCHDQFDISIQLLEKLRQNKFDFNQWITKGVPYFTSEQQQMIIDDKSFSVVDFYLENTYRQQQQILCNVLQDKWQKIVDWIDSGQENEFLNFVCRGNEDKRKILQKINHDYEHLMDNLFVRETEQDGKMILRFQKCSKVKKKMLQKKAQKEIQVTIDTHIGFSKLWNTLKQHFNERKRSFVGWDLFEIFYILVNSFEKKLSKKTYKDFKEFINENMFNKIYDVKLLSIKNDLKVQNLDQLYDIVVDNQQDTFPSFGYSQNKHSPAYRAYQIGCAYISLKRQGHMSMLNCLGLQNNNFYAMRLDIQGSDKILQQSVYKLESMQTRKQIEDFKQEMNQILVKLKKENKIQQYELLHDKNEIFVKLKFKLFLLKKIKS